ncbi:MAG: hypothetical protein ACPGN3_02835 [Opitutales bacterium]
MEDSQRFWLGRARRLAARVNFFLWVEGWLLAGVVVHIAYAAGVLWMRSSMDYSMSSIWLGYAGLIIVLAIAALWRCRGKWYTVQAALSRLEVHHELYGQLSAANEGKAEWPARGESSGSVQYRSTNGQVWFGLSLLFFVIALWIPIQKQVKDVFAPDIETPPDMTTVEMWLEVLKDDPSIDQAALEDIEDTLETLENEDPASWYDQASLEAASALREQLEYSLDELQEKLDLANSELGKALERMEGDTQQLSLGKEAMNALSELPKGAMPWRDSILEQLTSGQNQGPMSLDAEAMESLRQSMSRSQNTAQTLSDIGTMRRLSEEEMQQLLAQCQSTGPGGEGDLPGSGGVARGPGTAPLLFRPDDLPFMPETFEGVSNSDLSRASIGETIDTKVVSMNDRQDDEIETGLLDSRSALDSGQGGTATWQQSLTPAEAQRLKKFFNRDTPPDPNP